MGLVGLCAPDSRGAVVALKDRATVASGGSLSAEFTNAMSGGQITVYTDAVKDTMLTGYSPGSINFWTNYGASTTAGVTSGSSPVLAQFDLAALPGFGPGAVIHNAELRFRENNGNSGTPVLNYITTQDWSEGTKTGQYPGAAPAAPGANNAHPNGLNTNTNQKADGTPGNSSSGSWGVNGDTQFSVAGDSAMHAGTVQKTRLNGFRVWTVTDLVDSWAQGTIANRGFLLHWNNSGNYVMRLSEYGATDANHEPTLFIDYTPAVPEPATLALLFVSGLALVRRRS